MNFREFGLRYKAAENGSEFSWALGSAVTSLFGYHALTIMQKVVYHLADVERERNAGLPRSEVVQWYLEEIEGELRGVRAVDEGSVGGG